MYDAMCVLTETIKETRVICGGGCTEMLMANAIDKQVTTLTHPLLSLTFLHSHFLTP